MVEHCVELGEEVRAGQFIAKIDYIERTGSPSQEYYASIDGNYSGRYFVDYILLVNALVLSQFRYRIKTKLNRLLRRL